MNSNAELTTADILNEYLQEIQLTASTTEIKHVESIERVWIRPYIGTKDPSKLNDGNIQFILDYAARQGRSKKTIMDIKAAMFKFFKWARRNQYLTYVPNDVCIPRSARLKGKTILNAEDIVKLMTCENTVGGRKEEYIHAFRIQVLTGMRPGEVWGVHTDDVLGDVIHLHRSINRYGEATLGKNENALRKIILSERAQNEITEQMKICNDENNLFGITSQSSYIHHWRKFSEYNSLTRVSIYELRHTFVSIACAGISTGELKTLVGHSKSMDTYGVYMHEFTNYDQTVRNSLNRLFDTVLGETE